jgi:cell division transport system permease protein
MAPEFLPAQSELQIPSNTVAYFFREAVRRIWVSKRTSFVAVAMIAISLLIVGFFLLLSENLQRAVVLAQGKSRVEIYLTVDAKPAQMAAVDSYLASHRDLARRRFVSRDEALRRFASYFTNLNPVLGQLDGNPFPPSFECDVAPRMVQSAAFAREVTELRAMAGVDDVQFDWEWVRRLKRVVNIVNIVGLVAGGILALAAAFTIANVIRLTMMFYREEIAIMRLVGATERIIRGPFLIEGLLQGILGAVVAVAILFAAFETGRRLLPPANSLIWSFLFNGFLPWEKIAALVAGGMIAGYFGSWLSVRESGEELA